MDDSDAKTIELQVDDVVDGRYRINRRLGRGGMGTVYESQQIKLQRQVALKVLRPEFASKEMATKRFEREAKSASSIDHRNVVKILDFGHLESGELYYTMELLQGRDLSQVLREHGALPWTRAGWILLQIVRAFAAVHDKGIVHRDIKPANCFLVDPKPGDEPDYVKILDFGIANLQEQGKATALTAASDIIGSVLYMAPEQAASDHVDARTDIYSLGIMMYELLTGQVPFRENNVFQVMIKHQHEAPRPPRELVPEIPPEVEAIILRALAKQPDARFQSMGEIEAELLPLVMMPGSGVLQRTSPGVDPSRPAKTEALSVGSPGTGVGRGAETTPRLVPSPLAFAKPPRRAGGGRWWLVPVAFAALVFAGGIGTKLWLERARDPHERDALAKTELVEDEALATKKKGEEPSEAEDGPLQLAPPPEEQYDPFADPFGAPPLRGRMGPPPTAVEGAAAGEGTVEGDGVPSAAVPLEELLPPEPWTLEAGSVAGQLLDDKGRGLAKARVCAWIVDPRAPLELRRRPKCAEADRKGRFEIHDVVPGFYDLNAFARGFLPQSLVERDGYPLTVQPGAQHKGVELTLEPGGVEVVGTVETMVGDPIRSASVAAVGSVRALAVTDADGTFSLWMAEGDVSVVAWANGYTDVVARGRSTEPFAIVLRRESILFGTVVDPETGEPIERARVRAGATSGIDPLVYTNAAGEFRIPALAAGMYEPTARTDDAYGQATKPVKVLEGTISAEVVIQARRIAVAPKAVEPAVEPAVVKEVVAEPAGDGTTGAPDEGEDALELDDEPEGAPIVASDEAAKPPVAATAPAEPGSAAAAKPTDRSLRKAFALKLKRCGADGTIEIKAKYVLDTGKLFQPEVRVTGAAAKDPAVKPCAEKLTKGLTLLRRKEPSSFEPMSVTL